jgi:hypothetical protein
MVSLVQPLENGAMIEVGMIGNEGFVGVSVLLGADTSPLETMVQIPGSALRMQAGAFREEISRRSYHTRFFGGRLTSSFRKFGQEHSHLPAVRAQGAVAGDTQQVGSPRVGYKKRVRHNEAEKLNEVGCQLELWADELEEIANGAPCGTVPYKSA